MIKRYWLAVRLLRGRGAPEPGTPTCRTVATGDPLHRHRPETTLLYTLVDEHYPAFADQMAAQGTSLLEYVRCEFDEYLKCGCLEHGFLRVRCESCHAEHLVAFSCRHRGFCPSCGARRMAESVALLVDEVLPKQPIGQWVLSFLFQLRFLFAGRPAIMGQVLGIVYRTIATHLLKYVERPDGLHRFHWVKAPTSEELTQQAHTIAQRIGRFLERQGLLQRDAENSYLAVDALDEDPINQLLRHSITYRIAVGSQADCKSLR